MTKAPSARVQAQGDAAAAGMARDGHEVVALARLPCRHYCLTMFPPRPQDAKDSGPRMREMCILSRHGSRSPRTGFLLTPRCIWNLLEKPREPWPVLLATVRTGNFP